MLDFEIAQVIIQIIAFLIMLFIMKRYGWKPLLDTLENRKIKIQNEFDSIAAQKETLKELNMQYEVKLKEIDQHARNKIQEAIATGRMMSAEIQKDAQSHAKIILDKAKSDLQAEVLKAKIDLKKDVVNLVVKTTGKFLQENINADDQLRLIAQFVEEAKL